jgi:hypothetical protein
MPADVDRLLERIDILEKIVELQSEELSELRKFQVSMSRISISAEKNSNFFFTLEPRAKLLSRNFRRN